MTSKNQSAAVPLEKNNDMSDVFQSEKVIFCGDPGYMVSQYHNGEKVVEQFIRDADYEAFCEAILPFRVQMQE